MKKRAGIRLMGLCLLILVMMGAGTVPASSSTFYGCFTCKYVSLTGIGERCDSVAPLEGGDGWICHEDNTLPWPDGPICWVEGGACANGGSGGGGAGGGTGGGGSNPCTGSGFCPAQCFSCSGGGGRPRVI